MNTLTDGDSLARLVREIRPPAKLSPSTADDVCESGTFTHIVHRTLSQIRRADTKSRTVELPPNFPRILIDHEVYVVIF